MPQHLLKSTITETFLERVKQSGDKVAFRSKKEGFWQSVTFGEFFAQVNALAHGLRSQIKIHPGMHVGIWSRTRYEWVLADMTLMSLRAVTVPIHATSTGSDLEYLLNHSECQYLFLENAEQFEILLSIEKKLPHLKGVFFFEDLPALIAREKTKLTVETLSALSSKNPENSDELIDSIRTTQLHDTLTLCYTSATTGEPKGVVLTHENLTSVLQDCLEVFKDSIRPESEELLTFLPLSHIIGKLEVMAMFVFGWKLNFAENLQKLDENLKEVKPTILFAVPRIFDRAYEKIEEELHKTSWAKRKAFSAGLYTSKKLNRLILEQEIVPSWIKMAIPYFRKFILKRVMDAFGGRLRFVICGGAPLSRPVGEYFKALGIHILEGYGLTESCAPVTLNTLAHTQFGSVGRPLPEVELRIEEDGEILIRSRKIFKEYFKNPGATEAAFNEGWFLTGDVGFIDPQGFLHITDRKKDLIILSGGKNIAPQKIENRLKELDLLIDDVLVVGDAEKTLAALITLSVEELVRFAENRSILYADLGQLYRHPKVTEHVQDAVDELNRGLSRPERIRKFLILSEPFSQAKGELSVSMKVRRARVVAKYYKEIRQLFSTD
jgi:long-chain acyl-CoA synthetase